jgi:hypothetical protein
MADSTGKRKLQIMNVILGLHRANYIFIPLFAPTNSTFPSLQALVASHVGIFHDNIHSRKKNSTQKNVFYFACNAVKAECISILNKD